MDRQDLKEGQEVYVKGRVIHTGDHLDIILDKGSFIENAIILHHEKPVIPQFVAKWLEDCKEKKQSLYSALQDCDSVNNWLDIEGNEELFARAWLDGYEVEQEKLYTVEIPDPNADSYSIALGRKEGKVCIRQFVSQTWQMNCSNQLTEAEIKQDFDWAWQWAKPIEVQEVE